MALTIAPVKKPSAKTDTIVVGVGENNVLSPEAQAVDAAHEGVIAHVLSGQTSFSGKTGETLVLPAPQGAAWRRIVLLGTGNGGAKDGEMEEAGGKLLPALKAAGARNAALLLADADAASRIVLGLRLRVYGFDKYKAAPQDGKAAPKLERLEIVTAGKAAAQTARDAVAEGVIFARDLANEPPNVLYPESFAQRLKDELSPLGVTVEIIDDRKMEKLGFHAHLAVGMGSARPPRVVVMRWQGSKPKDKPVALVGKGVTFDTGGISIKPSAAMDEMKMDMGGAAAVAGAMKAAALRKARVNLVGVVGLAENMPSDRAYRPGDIIRSFAGKTIEVLNTDAEGRLVLCDALAYVQKTYDPSVVIDLATLTGAIVVALGSEYAGAFANDDGLWAAIDAAGKATGEKYWRMPLDKSYRKEMESEIADLKNLGGRMGGSCSAAGFLEHFIDAGRPWAHLDIAGMAWVNAKKPFESGQGTGFGVRMLDRLIADRYER